MLFWSVVCLFAILGSGWMHGVSAAAEQEAGTKVPYQVFFVDSEDRNTSVFYPQEGMVPEGTRLQISFPEQIVGSDGHFWHSLAESPQEFPVDQYGVHKYFIFYQQGEKLENETETGQEALLQEWVFKAWQADCAITGEDPEELKNPYLIGETQTDQDQRIRQLVSQIADADWHSFYLIGKNHAPQTGLVGTAFDTVYSSLKEAQFSVGSDWYQVVRVRVKRKFQPETCSHHWICLGREEAGCFTSGSEHWRCMRCEMEETVRLAASGHRDPEHTGSCIQCGRILDEEAKKEQGELIVWKEGEVQLRRLGDQVYRFVCVDEDYRSGKGQHRTGALFLCDSVIRSDQESDSSAHRVLSFGADNNYKTSVVRDWLQKQSAGETFQLAPVSVGVLSAYTGSTGKGSGAGLLEDALKRYTLSEQWMTDFVFLLSLEEALRYREVLWCFGNELSRKAQMGEGDRTNGKTQLSAYSRGYYLRTPCYEENGAGEYRNGSQIYVVDLETENIHPAEVTSETYGLRPAFVLPQG